MHDRTHRATGSVPAGTGLPACDIVIVPPAGQIDISSKAPKRSCCSLRKKKNKDDLKERRRKGQSILYIKAYDLRAETFARRHCGLTGRDPTHAEIEQAITDHINREGK